MGNQQGKASDGAKDVEQPMTGISTSSSPIKIAVPNQDLSASPGRGDGVVIPGSPLAYGPQPPMEPFSAEAFNAQNVAAQPSTQEFHGVPGWPDARTLVPIVLVWSHGAESVEVEGSWDNWQSRLSLLKSGKDFTIVKLLMPGVYQYKFIVDGQWKYAPDQAAIFDEMGNVNNIVEVQEHIPENIDGLSSFEAPPSPPSSYNNGRMVAEDFSKDPPLMPQHLNLTLLNMPMFVEAPTVLPRPQHVILNHVYEEANKSNRDSHVVGMTYRYKSKYVTTVLYSKDGAAGFKPT